MRHDLELAAGLLEEVDVLGVGDDRLAKVDGSVDDALLLLSLQDTWDDGLGGDAVAAVVHHHGAQGVEALEVHSVVHL